MIIKPVPIDGFKNSLWNLLDILNSLMSLYIKNVPSFVLKTIKKKLFPR